MSKARVVHTRLSSRKIYQENKIRTWFLRMQQQLEILIPTIFSQRSRRTLQHPVHNKGQRRQPLQAPRAVTSSTQFYGRKQKEKPSTVQSVSKLFLSNTKLKLLAPSWY